MSTIKWSPVTAHLCNNAPGTIVVGSPGSGKTFFMINVAANCLGMGQKVIVIDPKNDFNKLYNVNKNIELIDISNVREGALNPFTFLRKKDKDGNIEFLDTSTLITIIECLCGKLDKETRIDIMPIVKDFVTKSRNTGEYVDMQDVADYLFQNNKESAQSIGTQLKTFEDNKMGKLLFTRQSDVEPLELSETSSMVITLHGMQLPGYDKKPEDYNSNERLTSTILFLLTTKLFDILQQDNVIPTTFICDEAQLLFANPEMSSVIDNYLRLGRSLNVATILASQGITSFPEKISNNITSKFLFKSSIDEAEAFLNRFDTSKLDPANAIDVDNIISAATKFPTGMCFFIDRLGRNGVIRIKSIYDVNLLTSNPILKKRDKKRFGIKDDEDSEETKEE